MKTTWIKKENNSSLILFFAGWGADEKPVGHLTSEGYDLLVASNYTDLSFNEDISSYDKITLISWSFGVFAASQTAPLISNIKKAIAINGTPIPIDLKNGVPPKMFKLTLDTLSPKSLKQFTKNMFTEHEEYLKFKKPNRTFDDQKLELEKIQEHAQKLPESKFEFDCAIIASKDRVIPAKNLNYFWSTKDIKVVKLDCGHFPFFKYNSWNEIIEYDTNY